MFSGSGNNPFSSSVMSTAMDPAQSPALTKMLKAFAESAPLTPPNNGAGAGEIATKRFFLSNLLTNGINSMPHIHGRSAGGTTNPSGVCQFSNKQHNDLSVAVNVEFNKCTYDLVFSGPFCGAP